MHQEHEYQFKKYLYIKLWRHGFILGLTTVLYFLTQVIVTREYASQIGASGSGLVITTIVSAALVSLIYWVNRYRFDYVLYKYLFSKNKNMRLLYTHNQLIGPLAIYLIVVFTGVIGMGMLILLSRPSKDYYLFKKDVEILNTNYNKLIELIGYLNNGEFDDYAEMVGVIKYNISMYNMYEIALFDCFASTIEYDQLLAIAAKQATEN